MRHELTPFFAELAAFESTPDLSRADVYRRLAPEIEATLRTVVQEDLTIDLPDERDQLHTRSSPRFAELRAHVYEQIQRAKHHSGDTVPRTTDRTDDLALQKSDS